MRVTFRLARILEEYNQNNRGAISRIAKFAGIERHKMSKLLRSQSPSIPLEALAGICKFLIDECHVPSCDLPGRLFALEPDDFWSLTAQRDTLEICFGVRGKPPGKTVSWADSYLHAVLLHELYGAGHEGLADRPKNLELALVPAYRRQEDPQQAQQQALQARERGQRAYDEFHALGGDRGLVCLGSVKSSVVVETLISSAMRPAGAQPYVSEDSVPKPAERSCPFFFRFRETDPCPPSCYGGFHLSRASRRRKLEPGIYYEDAKQTWKCLPCSSTEDAALVFYVFRPPEGILEVCMGGFSAHGTACLARMLRELAPDFWPPTFDRQHLRVGAFLVHFDLTARNEHEQFDDEALTDIPSPKTTVIPVPAEALERRLDK